ncbi:MAG: hypothetical protein J6U54_18865 [Clostridiales bacterium]|nr:hypothetical protein [Clostridiales bacterium]
MNNEEAIKILDQMPISSDVNFEEIAEAIEMAIEALKREALVVKMKKAYYKELKKEADNETDN